MKKINGVLSIIGLISVMVLTSCSSKLNFNVTVNEDTISVENLGKDCKEIKLSLDSKNGSKGYTFRTEVNSIGANEKIVLKKSDFYNDKIDLSLPEEHKVISVRFFDGKNSFEWKYTPVYSDPAGYTFISNNRKIKFYKYSKAGNFTSYSKSSYGWIEDESNSFLHGGTYEMDDNNKLILHCGKWIWDGHLEDDELVIEIRGGTPEGASLLFSPKEIFKVQTGTYLSKKNLQENEKYSDYESTLLLSMAQNYNGDKLIEEYAKIYHNEEYLSVKNDEFAWYDKKKEYLSEYKNKLNRLEKSYSLRFNWNLGDYDFDKECFKIDFSKDYFDSVTQELEFLYHEVENRNDVNLSLLENKYSSVSQLIPLMVPEKNIFGTTRPLKFNLHMSKDEAKKFLESRKLDNGKTDKNVLVVVYYKIPDSYSEQLFASLVGKSFNVAGSFYKIEVYDNENSMNKLYSGSIK